jgi:acyl dehydratase
MEIPRRHYRPENAGAKWGNHGAGDWQDCGGRIGIRDNVNTAVANFGASGAAIISAQLQADQVMTSPTDTPREKIYYEDLVIGRVYRGGTVNVTAEEIVAFATRYDPQPFHLDPTAAQQSVFGGLVASGWLTASLTMRLMVTSEFRFGEGVVGLGIEALRWPQPVRPGDTLTATIEIAAMRTSESKPDFGVVKIRTTTVNQREETVQILTSNVLVPRRERS